jgi:hypothetical protein
MSAKEKSMIYVRDGGETLAQISIWVQIKGSHSLTRMTLSPRTKSISIFRLATCINHEHENRKRIEYTLMTP